MVILNNKSYTFPDIQKYKESDFFEEGIVAIGGDLHPQRLINAYKNGIFPWYNKNEPILWWSPKKRGVIFLDDLHISKNLAKVIKKQIFTIKFNTDFEKVIQNCKSINRKYAGTWIDDNMQQAYTELFNLGYAHSVEVYYDNKLVGGLYGVVVGGIFCGESMFAKKTDASKVALYYLVEKLKYLKFDFIDCQILNEHLQSLGAVEISRNKFFTLLNKSLLSKSKFII